MLAGESPAAEAARRMPKDSATIGLAIREGKAVATTNVLTDPRIVLTPEARAAVARTGYGALLAVPLVVRGRVIGALALGDRPGRAFHEEESRLLQAFADHAALALANAQLVHETRVRETRLEELVETTRQLSRLQPLDTLLTRISEACGRLVNSSSVGFRLVDGDELVATGAIADSDGDMMSLPRLKIGESLSGIVALSGEPLVVSDNAEQDPRVLPRHLANLARAGQRAWLGVPVKTGDRVAGVFSIRTRREEGFSEADVAIAKAFAAQAAVALENARLYTESEQRRREAEVFADLARSITASLDPDMVLTRVAGWARELCASDIASIALRDAGTDGFTVRHRSGADARTSPAPRISPGRGLGGLVLLTGEPARTDDYTTDPRFQAEPEMVAGVRQDGIVAVLSVPIRSLGRIEGLLYVCNRSRRAFTDRDEAVLTRLAEHAAIAIHNSRLFVREQSARAAAEESERALRDREAQLRQSQKMEAVGQLAGGVAHDFNNLLTVIAGRSELLSRRLRDEDPLRRDVMLIQKTVERASALTRQLLAFSRKQVLQARVVDLGHVVTGLCPMLQRLLGEDIELVIVPTRRQIGVRGDIGQLEQVIVNLAVNARDAMPGGGRLVIEVRDEQLTEAQATQVGVMAGLHAVLSVTDTGVGMDKTTQSRIFEPFFTTKAPGKGTGLGLSTVYGIIQQHQGAVVVQSRVGHGTTFKVYLPLTDEAPVAVRPDNFHGIPTGTETILLVEDEEEVRILAREVLEHAGYTVLEAATGPDALETAHETTRDIHLLLTDVIMPRMNGRQLAERLVAVWPTLKVLYMSGYTKDVLEPHDLSSGLLLYKPFTPQSLARRVRDVLDEEPRDVTAPASGTAARSR
jgi:signal transduction histidine kinase